MIGIFLLQSVKQEINSVLEILVILADFHSVKHFNERRKVLFLGRRFIVNVPNQRSIEQRFSLHPKIVACFTFAFGVGDKGSDDLQYILFRVDIGKWIEVHRLRKVDRIEHPDFVVLTHDFTSLIPNDITFFVPLWHAAL